MSKKIAISVNAIAVLKSPADEVRQGMVIFIAPTSHHRGEIPGGLLARIDDWTFVVVESNLTPEAAIAKYRKAGWTDA